MRPFGVLPDELGWLRCLTGQLLEGVGGYRGGGGGPQDGPQLVRLLLLLGGREQSAREAGHGAEDTVRHQEEDRADGLELLVSRDQPRLGVDDGADRRDW